jgi:hypothetical protein
MGTKPDATRKQTQQQAKQKGQQEATLKNSSRVTLQKQRHARE